MKSVRFRNDTQGSVVLSIEPYPDQYDIDAGDEVAVQADFGASEIELTITDEGNELTLVLSPVGEAVVVRDKNIVTPRNFSGATWPPKER